MKYYNQISKGYGELHGDEQLRKAKIIASRLELKKDDKLLDVGCGSGLYLDLFKCKVAGVDPSEALVKQYKDKHKLMVGRAEKLAFPDNSFDVVVSITAIHNFEDIEKGLKEIRRVGKNKFAFSVLKRSNKTGLIEKLINELFAVNEIIIENKDLIFFCTKKGL